MNIPDASSHIDELSSKLESLKKTFAQVTSQQAERIRSLLAENALLQERIEDLQNASVSSTLPQNSTTSAPNLPFIRGELRTPTRFMKYIKAVEALLQEKLPEEVGVILWPDAPWNKERVSYIKIESIFHRAAVGIAIDEKTSSGTMRIVHQDMVSRLPVVFVPLSSGTTDKTLIPGDIMSVIPNPELFNNSKLQYALPAELTKMLQAAYVIEGNAHNFGMGTYTIAYYPRLVYKGQGLWELFQKGHMSVH